MTISFSIMSVPERRESVARIVSTLKEQFSWCPLPHLGLFVHEDTDHKGPWEAWKSSWLLRPSEASYHVILQDDILLCQDFLQTMHALTKARPDSPISGFLPRKSVDNAVKDNLRWVSTKRFLWGQCLMMPVKMGDDALAWIADNEGKIEGWSHHDDVRLASFFNHIGTPVFVAVPHPVEHIGDELGSVLKHYGPAKRRRGRAWWGEEKSIANLNWGDLKCAKD